jgi:hypothetical protein
LQCAYVDITTTGGERREIDAAEDLTGTNLPNLFKIKSPQPPPPHPPGKKSFGSKEGEGGSRDVVISPQY